MEHAVNFKELLIQHNIRPSNYRIRILECLADKKLHPTADEIYQNLIQEFPTLSKMSVYNTIYTLVEGGLIRKITIDNTEVRYDSFMEDHGHFRCEKCGKVTNFDVKMSEITFGGLHGFKIVDKDVFFKGVCPSCQKL